VLAVGGPRRGGAWHRGGQRGLNCRTVGSVPMLARGGVSGRVLVTSVKEIMLLGSSVGTPFILRGRVSLVLVIAFALVVAGGGLLFVSGARAATRSIRSSSRAATPRAGSATRTPSAATLAPLNQSIVYALNGEDSAITEYAPGASGNVAPFASIHGTHTQLGQTAGLAVSPGRKVYVSARTTTGAGAIMEFAPGANGDVAPQTVISGSATGLNGNTGIALDKAGDLWVANASGATIAEYGPAASGNAAPKLTISGSGTHLQYPFRLTFDAAGNLWVGNSQQVNSTVTEYPAAKLQQTSTQPVNLAPIATLAPSGAQTVTGVAFDPLGGLHVADQHTGALLGFAPGAPSGNPAPSANVTGSNTMLSSIDGVTADPAGRLYVAAGEILEFNDYSAGNVAPVALIGNGPATQLDGAIDVAVSPPAPVTLASAATLHPVLGARFSSTLTGGGGVGPYRFAVSSGTLPAGLSLSANGVLSGTVTSGGTTTVTIKITDSGLPSAHTGTQPLQLAVTTPQPLAVSARSLPAGAVAQVYDQTLAATGGLAPYTWSITGGSLPAGVALNSAGQLFGVPNQTGTFTFTATVADSASPTPHTASATLSLSVTIRPGVYVTNAGSDSVTAYPVGAGGDLSPFADITGPDTGLSTPEGLALDAAGDIYVASEGNDTVTEYPPGSSGDVKPLLTIRGVSQPCRVALDGSGHLYVAALSSTVSEYKLGSGAPTLMGTLTGQNGPRGLAVDAKGDLWVSESTVNAINEYAPNPSGNASPIAALGGPDTGVASPQGLVFDAAGNLSVANAGGVGIKGTVTLYSAAQLIGDSVPYRTLTSGLVEPLGVDRGTDGTLFVADVGGPLVAEYSGPSITPTTVISGQSFTNLNVPVSVAATPPLSIITTKARAARRGRHYLVNLVAAEGTTPYHWAVIHGRLPRGLKLRRTGAIIGTPKSRARVYRFTIRVIDSTHPKQRATQVLKLRVRPAPPRHHRNRHHR
jgi:large repetitive protein